MAPSPPGVAILVFCRVEGHSGDIELTHHDIFQEDERLGSWSDIRSLLSQLSEFTDPGTAARMRWFSLQLGDGNRWHIAGSRQASLVAEKLGTIMQLQEGDPQDGHLMFFYEENDTDHQRLELARLQAQGWIRLYDTHFQMYFHPRLHHVICGYRAGKENHYSYALMSTVVHTIHWASICRGGLPVHGTLIEHQGKGIILAGRSGVGKSTCSRRVTSPWQALCDDEILVVSAPGGGYLAHPFPTWMDYLAGRAQKTWKVEHAVPLVGIFLLEQSPTDKFAPVEGAEAAVAATNAASEIMLFHVLCNSDPGQVRELRRTVFDNACQLVRHVPAFRLWVSLTGRFWEQIASALNF